MYSPGKTRVKLDLAVEVLHQNRELGTVYRCINMHNTINLYTCYFHFHYCPTTEAKNLQKCHSITKQQQVRPSSGTYVYPHMLILRPHAAWFHRRRISSVTFTSKHLYANVYMRVGVAHTARFVQFWASGGPKFTKMGDSLPWMPMNRRDKFDTASFIQNHRNKPTSFQCCINRLLAYLLNLTTCLLSSYLFPYLSTSLRIHPFRFKPEGQKRWSNLALVLVLILCYFVMDACLHLLSFNFSVLSQEIGWEERLRNEVFCVGWDVKP